MTSNIYSRFKKDSLYKIIWNTIEYIQIVCIFQERLSVYESSGQGKSNGLSAKLFDDAFQVRAFLQLDIRDMARKDWKGMMFRSSKDFRECCCISLATRSLSVAQKRHAVKSKISPKPNLCRPLCGSNCPHLPSHCEDTI